MSVQGEPNVVRAVQRQLDTISEHLAANQMDMLSIGNELTFNSLCGLLKNMHTIVALCKSAADAEAIVAPVHRAFLVKMLEKRSFNTMLALARESNVLLQCARMRAAASADEKAAQLAPMLAWLDEHHIVDELLTVNMHQRQYVDVVQQLLTSLADAGALEQGVLLNLWGKLKQVSTSQHVRVANSVTFTWRTLCCHLPSVVQCVALLMPVCSLSLH